MLDEYKESFRQCADLVEGWQELSKNDLCRKYVENKGNPLIQNSYFSAIMYRYWGLISKYYYMSDNVASPETCYEWLEDSVYGCLKATSWEREDSSIYKDPNGPDKVINRCMKCARLTYYQFINRKKRKDDFGLLSLEEIIELFGTTLEETSGVNPEEETTGWAIYTYIQTLFNNKDYFVAVMLDCIKSQDVFDVVQAKDNSVSVKFNIRKLTKCLTTIGADYISHFASTYDFLYEEVEQGCSYIKCLKPQIIKAKIVTCLERLQHDSFFNMLRNG